MVTALTIVAVFLKGSLRTGLILIIILLGGWLRQEIGKPHPSPLERVLGTRESITQEADLEVVNLISEDYHSHAVRLIRIAGQPVNEKILLMANRSLPGGSRWRGVLELTPLNDDPVLDIFPGKYKARAYPKSLLTPLPGGARGLSIARLRYWLLKQLDTNLGENSGFAKALLLSDVVSQNEHRAELTRGGMIHLIVVSGLHVWFIYAICVTLFYLFLPRKISEILFLVLILVFSALNNWSPPILRATLMIGLLIISRWFDRPVSNAQILSLSLLIITVIDPNQLFSVSLQLSYASIIVIMFGIPKYRLWRVNHDPNLIQRLMKSQTDYLIISALIGLALLPITHHYFGTGGFNGIVGNLVGVPLSGVILPLAFVLMLVPQRFILLPPLKLAYDFLVSFFMSWTKFAASLPFFSEGVYWNTWRSLAVTVAIILVMLIIRGRWKLLRYSFLPALLLIVGLLFIPGMLNRSKENLYIFNSGVSDAAFLRLRGGMNLMIDTGQVYGTYAETEAIPEDQILEQNWLKRNLLQWFSKEGISDIDWLVLTHMHTDHVGGLPSLLKAVRVRNIILSDESLGSSTWQYMIRKGYLGKTKIYALRDTLTLDLGSARVKFLHPDKDYYSDKENNRSIVLRLDHGKKRYLFTGDIESTAEEYLLEKYPQELKADFLKVAHHGSASSSSPEFIEAVSPAEAVITASRRNRYHFPSQQVLRRLCHAGVKVLKTSDGTVVIPL